MSSLVTPHISILYVMPTGCKRAFSAFPDPPVKPGNDENVVLLMNSLVIFIIKVKGVIVYKYTKQHHPQMARRTIHYLRLS